MTNFKKYDIGCDFTVKIDFADYLPENHYCRKIEEIVSKLNLDAILNNYKQTGQKAYNPYMLLSIIFYGYLTGIRSGRKLKAACKRDLVFIYLCKGYIIGKSTFNDFRKLNYIHFEAIFLQLLELCQKEGMVLPSISIMDGSKIDANSSKRGSKTKAKFEKALECLAEDIAELKKKAVNLQSKDLTDLIKSKEQQKSKLEAIILSYEEGAEKQKKNLTDPDAPIMRTKKGGYDTAYNVQIGCTENQIITYANVITEGNDKAQLVPIAEGIQKNTNSEIDIILADADYGNYDSFEYMDKENIEGYVPYRNINTDFNDQPYHAVHFKYDSEKDEYTCPQNETLIFKKEVNNKDRTYRHYQTDACKKCPFNKQCTNSKQETVKRRTIRREVRESLREKMKERLQSEEGKKMYVRRMHPVEAIFGHLKYNLGYTHFLLRGIEKVNAEFMLMCLTQNLRKLLIKLGCFFKILYLTIIMSSQIGKIPDMSINFCKNSKNQ